MELLKTFGPLLGQVAPTIATALGGPLAGVAVRTLSNALLGHENGSEGEVKQALEAASPEQLAQIKQIDADFEVLLVETCGVSPVFGFVAVEDVVTFSWMNLTFTVGEEKVKLYAPR